MITGRPFTQVNSIDDGEVAVHILPRVSWDTCATGIKLLEPLSISSKNLVLASGAPNDNFRKNICSEDDLRSRIFGTFVVKFLACMPLLGFSNI